MQLLLMCTPQRSVVLSVSDAPLIILFLCLRVLVSKETVVLCQWGVDINVWFYQQS